MRIPSLNESNPKDCRLNTDIDLALRTLHSKTTNALLSAEENSKFATNGYIELGWKVN
jgi:hypothetical protein